MTCIPALIVCHLSFLFDQRRPLCRRVSTYSSTGVAFAPIDPTLAPICVAPKPKCQKRTNNVFLDDQGFPDQSDDYNHVLHNVNGGPILRKLRHPAPALDKDTDPAFYAPFIPVKHEDQMVKNWTCPILIPTSREESTPLSEYIGLSSMRRVYFFQSKIMNASSTQEQHGPSQSRKSCTENARQSSCASASWP